MVKLFNLVKVNTATTGTGDVTFGAAFSNAFFTPSEAGAVDGDSVSYVLVEGDDTEIGTGVIGSSVTTMTRTVLKSKIGGSAGTTKMTLGGAAYLAFTALDRDILLPANNLSDVASATTSLTNLGGTTVGKDVFVAADAAAARSAIGVALASNYSAFTTTTSMSSSTYADTSVTLNITPTSASNKVKVTVIGTAQHNSTSAGAWLKLVRVIGGTPTDVGVPILMQNNAAAPNVAPVLLFTVDSPATTSVITYKVQIKSNVGGSTVLFPNSSASPAAMALEEVLP